METPLVSPYEATVRAVHVARGRPRRRRRGARGAGRVVEVAGSIDAAAFLAEAEPLLLADEARHNLILGIAGTIRDSPDLYPMPEPLARPRRRARSPPRAADAAVQPHPRRAALASEALAALAEAHRRRGAARRRRRGTGGRRSFAELWARHTGAPGADEHAPGRLRARARFEPPSGVPGVGARRDGGRPRARAALVDRLRRGGAARGRPGPRAAPRRSSTTGSPPRRRGILLWEDGGEPVSLAGWGGPTPNGIRVGPVYTPPELRGRGYATALTAELSQRLLDGRLFEGGRRFCFLYTDLANPTSNAIYERIGYRRVAESAEIVFG